MQNTTTPPHHGWHLLFLSRIYSFTGWLGLLGGVFLLLSLAGGQVQATAAPTAMFGMPLGLAAFLLIGWSIVLLNFSKDVVERQRWSTGICGWCIALFQLVSVPIGTAIGTYTLWVLFRNRQVQLK